MSSNINNKYLERKKILYFTSLILLLSYLIFASDIISLFIPNSVTKKAINLDKLKRSSVIYNIDSIEKYDDFLNTLYFAGWAFCETLEDNDEKEIWFIFKSDREIYIFKNEVVASTLDRTFKDKYNIRGNKHRFYSTVSFATMKNGLYKFYIYCKENNENYGLADTGILLKKGNREISQYKLKSQLTKITLPIIVDKQVKCIIDSVDIIEDCFEINGWAFIDGLDTINQSVYIRLSNEVGTDAIYDTQNITRPDVGEAYNNEIYKNSGFKAVIPIDELPDDKVVNIEILVENNGSVYSGSKAYMYSSGELTEIESYKPQNSTSNEVEISINNILVDSKLRYYIDYCAVNNFLNIEGWAYITDKDASITSVYLAITKPDGSTRVFTSTKLSRPDVAMAFNNELYSESGFKSVIPLDAISEGDNIITVIAEHDEI